MLVPHPWPNGFLKNDQETESIPTRYAINKLRTLLYMGELYLLNLPIKGLEG